MIEFDSPRAGLGITVTYNGQRWNIRRLLNYLDGVAQRNDVLIKERNQLQMECMRRQADLEDLLQIKTQGYQPKGL